VTPLPPLSQSITFTYAEPAEESWRFYEEVLGLRLVLDQGRCRIYESTPGSRGFLGVCRARAPRSEPNSRAVGGVVLTFVTADVEGFHRALLERGVAIEKPPGYSEEYRVTGFFFRDPAGYLLEVQRFEHDEWPTPC